MKEEIGKRIVVLTDEETNLRKELGAITQQGRLLQKRYEEYYEKLIETVAKKEELSKLLGVAE